MVDESGRSQSIEKAGFLEWFNEDKEEVVGQPCTSRSVRREGAGAIVTLQDAETTVVKSDAREARVHPVEN
ncbi:MAG: hypothetical protein JW388_0714 [Nitrospira sp.]|nr:hypothetical protein [Nitrospira sp.]